MAAVAIGDALYTSCHMCIAWRIRPIRSRTVSLSSIALTLRSANVMVFVLLSFCPSCRSVFPVLSVFVLVSVSGLRLFVVSCLFVARFFGFCLVLPWLCPSASFCAQCRSI